MVQLNGERMKQGNLEIVHREIAEQVQMWADGLTTDAELIHFMSAMHSSFEEAGGTEAASGLIDPNTGLCYE